MKQFLFASFFVLLFSCSKGQSGILAFQHSDSIVYDAATVQNFSTIDDGYYNAFVFPHQLESGLLTRVYKKASSHAAAGPMMFSASTNGGATWTEKQVIVGVTPLSIAALSYGVLSSGRLLIAYQDDEAYTSIKFAYSDDEGDTWVASTTLQFGAGYSSSPSPVKMVVLPSGKILCAYYKYGLGANPAIVGFIQSTNNGLTWSFGTVVDSNTGNFPFGPPSDFKSNEFAFAITHNTGNDATTKMIGMGRTAVANDGGGPFMFYKSSNGGATWTQDVTEDAGSFTDDLGNNVGGPFTRVMQYSFLQTNAPADLIKHKDSIYMIVGERSVTNGFGIKVISATPDGAFENKWSNWTRPRRIGGVGTAHTLGSTIDYGYPLFFVSKEGELWAQYYDVSPLPQDNSKANRRVLIKQIKIAD